MACSHRLMPRREWPPILGKYCYTRALDVSHHRNLVGNKSMADGDWRGYSKCSALADVCAQNQPQERADVHSVQSHPSVLQNREGGGYECVHVLTNQGQAGRQRSSDVSAVEARGL